MVANETKGFATPMTDYRQELQTLPCIVGLHQASEAYHEAVR